MTTAERIAWHVAQSARPGFRVCAGTDVLRRMARIRREVRRA